MSRVIRFLFVPTGRATRWDLFRAMLYALLFAFLIQAPFYLGKPRILVLGTIMAIIVCAPLIAWVLLNHDAIKRMGRK